MQNIEALRVPGPGQGYCQSGHSPSQSIEGKRDQEALVSSTQGQSFRVLGGTLKRLGREQLRSRQQALPSPTTCSDTVGGGQGPVQKQHRVPTFRQSAWHHGSQHRSGV